MKKAKPNILKAEQNSQAENFIAMSTFQKKTKAFFDNGRFLIIPQVLTYYLMWS
jgi:hypothetical protein